MKAFRFYAVLRGTVTVEDPHCPSYWRGSHVYDKEVSASCDVDAVVAAEDEAQARELITEYDGYDGLEEVESVDIRRMEIWQEDADYDEPGIDPESFTYGEVEGAEDCGPDPDEVYERRRDARLPLL